MKSTSTSTRYTRLLTAFCGFTLACGLDSALAQTGRLNDTGQSSCYGTDHVAVACNTQPQTKNLLGFNVWNPTFSRLNDGVTLKWNAAIGDAVEYEVYRSTVLGQIGDLVYRGSELSFTDTGSLTRGNEYLYSIKACDATHCIPNEANLNQTYFYLQKTSLVDNPVITMSEVTGGFKVKWNVAANPLGPLDQYKVFRITKDEMIAPLVYSGSNTGFVDTGLVKGNRYDYIVMVCEPYRCFDAARKSILYTGLHVHAKVHINLNSNVFGTGDKLSMFVSSSNVENSSGLYDIKLGLEYIGDSPVAGSGYSISPDSIIIYSNNGAWGTENGFAAKSIGLGAVPWSRLISYVFDASLPRGVYIFSIGAFDADGNLISTDEVSFYFYPDKEGFLIEPAFESVSQTRAVQPKFIDPVEKPDLSEMAELLVGEYHFLKKAADIVGAWSKVNSAHEVVQEVVQHFNLYNGDDEYSKDTLAINIMLSLVKHATVLGLDAKNFSGGIQSYYNYLRGLRKSIPTIDQYQMADGYVYFLNKRHFFSADPEKNLKVKFRPIEICADGNSGYEFNFNACEKELLPPGDSITYDIKTYKNKLVGHNRLAFSKRIGLWQIEATDVETQKVYKWPAMIDSQGQTLIFNTDDQ